MWKTTGFGKLMHFTIDTGFKLRQKLQYSNCVHCITCKIQFNFLYFHSISRDKFLYCYKLFCDHLLAFSLLKKIRIFHVTNFSQQSIFSIGRHVVRKLAVHAFEHLISSIWSYFKANTFINGNCCILFILLEIIFLTILVRINHQ